MNKNQFSSDALSQKYDQANSERYYHKHRKSIDKRFSNWLEQRIAKLALEAAGEPEVVLDLPCGTGRFWPLLAKNKKRRIIAADNSEHMISTAIKYCQDDMRPQVDTLQTSAYDIKLPDESVDNVFCIRLLHHIGERSDRMKILNEFHRVSRDTVCISLWVDGNFKARRRIITESKKTNSSDAYQNRFVFPPQMVEKEFAEAGFKIVDKHDLAKYYSMWRIYTLRKTFHH